MRNLGGKETISTIFHLHKYNLLDQIRGSKKGAFDIAIKLRDDLIIDECKELFDKYCKTTSVPNKAQNNKR